MEADHAAIVSGALFSAGLLAYLLRKPPLRRVSLRLLGSDSGIVIRLPPTFGELLAEADRRLVQDKLGNDARAQRVFTKSSDEVLATDYDLIEPNETLYISCGEDWAAASRSALPLREDLPVPPDPIKDTTVSAASSSFFWATSAAEDDDPPPRPTTDSGEEPSFGIGDEVDAEAAFATIAKQFSVSSDAAPAADGFGVSEVTAALFRTAPICEPPTAHPSSPLAAHRGAASDVTDA